MAGGRFIPACAGNSEQRSRSRSLTPVHPRVCGELVEVEPRAEHQRRFIPACAGNSRRAAGRRRREAVHPRVCGELIDNNTDGLESGRFIPACAGNSALDSDASTPPAVHPRVCGELASSERRFPCDYGSSPRVRGTPWARNLVDTTHRFIPACAGNSEDIESNNKG